MEIQDAGNLSLGESFPRKINWIVSITKKEPKLEVNSRSSVARTCNGRTGEYIRHLVCSEEMTGNIGAVLNILPPEIYSLFLALKWHQKDIFQNMEERMRPSTVHG